MNLEVGGGEFLQKWVVGEHQPPNWKLTTEKVAQIVAIRPLCSDKLNEGQEGTTEVVKTDLPTWWTG